MSNKNMQSQRIMNHSQGKVLNILGLGLTFLNAIGVHDDGLCARVLSFLRVFYEE
jgi:hypothetical protein